MELRTVTTFLGGQLDQWCRRSEFWCPVSNALGEYRQTSQLLGACGHDNRELDAAIAGADTAFGVLVAARERAVRQFKEDGVCFSVDERRRKEWEEARLQ